MQSYKKKYKYYRDDFENLNGKKKQSSLVQPAGNGMLVGETWAVLWIQISHCDILPLRKTHKYRYLLKQIYKNTQIQRVGLSFEYRYPTVTFSHRGPVLVRWRPTQPSKSCKFERRRSRNKCLQQLIHKYKTSQIYSHERVEPRFKRQRSQNKCPQKEIHKYSNTQQHKYVEDLGTNVSFNNYSCCPQTELDGEIWDPNWKVSSWKIEHHHHWSELAASLINNFKGLGVRMRRGGTSYAKHKSLSYKKHRRISY